MNTAELQAIKTAMGEMLNPIITRIDALEGNVSAPVSKIKRTQKQGKTDDGEVVTTCSIKVEGVDKWQWVTFPAKPTRDILDAMVQWKKECPGGGGFFNAKSKRPNMHLFRCSPKGFDLVKRFAALGITARVVTVS
jgi:hypothetical protein